MEKLKLDELEHAVGGFAFVHTTGSYMDTPQLDSVFSYFCSSDLSDREKQLRKDGAFEAFKQANEIVKNKGAGQFWITPGLVGRRGAEGFEDGLYVQLGIEFRKPGGSFSDDEHIYVDVKIRNY